GLTCGNDARQGRKNLSSNLSTLPVRIWGGCSRSSSKQYINLMINLLYMLSEDSAKRAGDLVAYSHKEQEKYLRLAHGRRPEWMEKLDWDKINRYADAWEHNIATKAESCKQSFHYNVGYRFYSRIEHSDAWSLSNLIDENETQIRIASELSDKYVSIALVHS